MYNNNQSQGPRTESEGAIFPRDKKSQNSPDMSGDMTLRGEALRYIADQLAGGATEIKLYISTWTKQGRGRAPFASMAFRPPMEASQQGQQRGYQNGPQSYVPQNTQRPAPSYGQQAGGSRSAEPFPTRPIGQAPVYGNGPITGQFNRQQANPAPQRQTDPSLDFPGDNDPPF